YAVYSLPKILPMQYGAILKGVSISDDEVWSTYQMLDYFKREMVYQELERELPSLEESTQIRRENWKYLESLFEKDGIATLVKHEDEHPTALFLIETDDYQEMFNRYVSFGVETGRYYQGNGLFLPVQQNMNKSHLDYIYAVYRGYLNLSSNYSRGAKK